MDTLTREDRVQSLVNEVKAGVAKVQNSEDWKKWLDTQSRKLERATHRACEVAKKILEDLEGMAVRNGAPQNEKPLAKAKGGDKEVTMTT